MKYSQAMDIAVILREIDAEIEKLESIRNIVAELASPIRKQTSSPKRVAKAAPEVIVPEPTLIVLPPKQKREYRRQWKPAPEEPRALASKVPDRPVFVPKTEAPVRSVFKTESTAFNPEALEAALRQNFLGSVA
jgi:hypothetical protein